jgi:hypothetical protein
MIQKRIEVYDETGLIDVYFVDTDEPTQEEIIAQKEAELINIYNEIQLLKNNL